MIKKQTSGVNVIKNHSSASWLLLFSGLALFIFFFRGFLFNEYGGFHYYCIEDIVPFLVLVLLFLMISLSLIIFRIISLEKKRRLETKDLYNLFKEAVLEYKDLGIFYFFISFSFFVTIFLLWMLREAGNSALLYLSLIFILFIIISGSLIILIKLISQSINIFHFSDINAGNIKNTKQLISLCMESEAFRFLMLFIYFFLFLGAFLSDLFKRSNNEAMGGVYIAIFILASSFSSSILIFMGMLIATKGIRKSIFTKFLFLLLTIVVSIFIFYVFYRILWIDFYL